MKLTRIIYFFTLTTILISCKTKKTNVEPEILTEKTSIDYNNNETFISKEVKSVKGDYNGDGIPEYASIKTPEKVNFENCDCEGKDCLTYIVFSDKTIPQIEITSDIGGYFLQNVGDLNNDGKDELLYQLNWCTSEWRSWNLWTFKNEKWIYAIEPFAIRGDVQENEKIVTKDFKKKGNIIIKYSSLKEKNIGEIVTKSVPFK